MQSHGKFVEAVWHISSVGRVCVAVDSLQPAILLNPLLRPLEHPRADTGEEGGREGVPFHQGWRRAEHTMALVLGEWEKVSITAMGTACHPVRHKHPAHGCPHSYPRVLPGHQSTQPASRVAARTAGLPALVQDGAGDRGASPWDHAVHFRRTCWLGEATRCSTGSHVLSAMQRAGDWAQRRVGRGRVLGPSWEPLLHFACAAADRCF